MSRSKLARVCLLVVVLVVLLSGCNKDVQVKLTTGLNEGELFRIEKTAGTEAEARLFLMNQKNQYEASYGENIWKASIEDTTFAAKMKAQLEDDLYQLKGMVVMAEARGIALSEDEKNRAAAAAKEYLDGLSQEAVSYLSMTQEQLTALYEQYRLAERLVAQVTAIVEEEISDDEARVIEVQQIRIPLVTVDETGETVAMSYGEKEEARALAWDVGDRAVAGENFNSLQEQYSSDGVGNLRVSRYDVEDAWETAVFALGSGEVSGVIETEEALYIVRCVSNMLKEETITNKEVIRERKKAEVFFQEYNAFVAKLMVQAKAEGMQGISFTNWVPDCDVDFYEVYENHFPE